MAYFLRRLLLFVLIPTIFLSVVFIAVPATPRSQTSLLFSKLDKDDLLENTPGPRLILLGGSNLSFGLDSSILERELKIHPINTSIQATIGTEFILDTVIDYVRPGDTVVLSPEYSQFYGRNAYGGEELLRLVMDVDRSALRYIDLNQWLNLATYMPKYTLSKINPSEYVLDDNPEIGIYEREAYNKYGDVFVHWAHEHSDFPPYDPIPGKINYRVFEMLHDFEKEVSARGGVLYITFPCLQEATYYEMEDQIDEIYQLLVENNFRLLGTPQRYMMDELLMYNTPYHLNRQGVEIRSLLLAEDLAAAGVGDN